MKNKNIFYSIFFLNFSIYMYSFSIGLERGRFSQYRPINNPELNHNHYLQNIFTEKISQKRIAIEEYEKLKKEYSNIQAEIKNIFNSLKINIEENELKTASKLKSIARNIPDIDGEIDDNLNKLILTLEATEKEIDHVSKIIRGKGKGDTVAEFIAGGQLNDTIVGENILDGIKTGLIIRSTKSIGEALGKNVEKTSANLLNISIKYISSFISFWNKLIFHKGKTPFEAKEIDSWKNLISNELKELEYMLKGSERIYSRGRDEILREIGEEFGEKKHDNTKKIKVVNTWKDLTEILIYNLEAFSSQLKERKDYYRNNNKNFAIIRSAESLAQILIKVASWLKDVSSLKDFSTLPEIQSVLPPMRKSCEHYFDLLIAQLSEYNYKNSYYHNNQDFHVNKEMSDMPAYFI